MVPENINTTYHKRFLKILRREGEDLREERFSKKNSLSLRIASRFFGKLTIYNIDS